MLSKLTVSQRRYTMRQIISFTYYKLNLYLTINRLIRDFAQTFFVLNGGLLKGYLKLEIRAKNSGNRNRQQI